MAEKRRNTRFDHSNRAKSSRTSSITDAPTGGRVWKPAEVEEVVRLTNDGERPSDIIHKFPGRGLSQLHSLISRLRQSGQIETKQGKVGPTASRSEFCFFFFL